MPRAAFALLLMTLTSLSGQEKTPVLILDGQNNHDFEATTASLKATLEATGLFKVEISRSPGPQSEPGEWDSWRPDFKRYRAVIDDYNGEPWPPAVKEAFLSYVWSGGGVLAIHAANNPFPGWREFERVTGLNWRGADYDHRLVFDADSNCCVRIPPGEGPGSGHGRQHAYVVTVRAPEHPIMAGLPPRWLHAKDELYHGQRGPAGAMTVLSTAWSDPATGGTGAHEPITWVIPYGEGKVVTTVLGHHWRGQKDFEALHCVGFQTVVARSTEWLATGRVTLGVPAAFPEADRTSVASPSSELFPAPNPEKTGEPGK